MFYVVLVSFKWFQRTSVSLRQFQVSRFEQFHQVLSNLSKFLAVLGSVLWYESNFA